MPITRIKKIYKEQLSYLLAKGHASFGKVAPRRPYRDDEDEGGGTASGLTLLQHPLLMNMPIGVDPTLTAVTTSNIEAMDEALERAYECCPQLQQQPKLKKALTYGHSFNPKPTMY